MIKKILRLISTICILTVSLILVLIIILGFGYLKSKKEFDENKVIYEAQVLTYLSDRFGGEFCVDRIIRNDMGIVSYCTKKDSDVIFDVRMHEGKIYYDTYIQSCLENELKQKIKEIASEFSANCEIGVTLKFYNEPDIGEQREVLYKQFQELGRVPLIEDTLNRESFSWVWVHIYDENFVDLKQIAKRINQLPCFIKEIKIRRYDLNKNKELDSYLQENTNKNDS